MSKKSYVVSLLIIAVMLIGCMFILTGCGNENGTTDDQEQTNILQLPVNLVNACPNTTITALYLSGAGQEAWGEELLKGQTIGTMEQISLTLNINKDNVKWDIKATDENGESVEFRNLDFSNASTSGATITLSIGANGPIATLN